MSVELRLTDVEPPLPDPKRTIYRDIVNLPDSVKLGLTIRYFNHDDVGLYMQITGSCAGYTFGTENLGLLASGANAYKNLDEFASRAKPSVGDLPDGEMEENVTLILRGYTDAGYSDLKWTFERVVTVHWINSANAAFTVDELDNFDDGTVQGWAAKKILESLAFVLTSAVAIDYVLSATYSFKVTADWTAFDPLPSVAPKNTRIRRDSTHLVFIGRPYDANSTTYPPEDRWLRNVVPLPKNTALEIQVFLAVACETTGPAWNQNSFCAYKSFTTANKNTVFAIIDLRINSTGKYAYLWLDDFKIISK